MRSLYDEMRSEQNLFSAWRHVKRSALNSTRPKIRGDASAFEHEHQRHLRRIGRELRSDSFEFDEVTGVLKDKKKREAAKKHPRPIAVSSLRNRVVQRAILQVLQPRTPRDIYNAETRYETKCDVRLGKINEINRSRFGVGGLLYPYGGVKPAIELITGAINMGARYFYQSDIQSFFTKIPTSGVSNFVRQETKDDRLGNIFAKALEVHLANEEELKGYAKLFPSGGIGVAQGSSLSAFAGNVLLFDVDHELNDMNVTAVRYIDDIIIVSATEGALEKAISHATKRFGQFGFSLYAPAAGSDKAARGRCADSFNFLGCTIQPNRCVPSVASIDRLKSDVEKTLSASRAAISETIRSDKYLDPKNSKTEALHHLGRKIYGWYKSFSFCTERAPFVQLDKQIFEKIENYERFLIRRSYGCDLQMKMKILGIPSVGELHRTELAKRKPVRAPQPTKSNHST